MSALVSQASKAWSKVRPFTDIRDIARRIKYHKIRTRYFREMWKTAAHNIGAHYNDTPFGLAEIARGGLSTFVSQSQVMLDSQIMLRVAGEKALTLNLLERLGAPVPRYCRVSLKDLSPAFELLRTEGVVVVKPAGGTGGGRGVITGITTPEALRDASKRASMYDNDLVIEEQIEGASYRLLFLDGEFIDAVRRDPPSVIGDGKRTIKQLIKQANADRERAAPVLALSPLVIDHDCRNWLEANGLSLQSRPGADEVVTIKRAVNQNDLRGNVNVRDIVHREIVEQCRSIVQRMSVQLAGVDLICSAIDRPFAEAGCRINEVNTTPGLHHHYLISNSINGVPAAEIILEYLFSNRTGVMRLGGDGDVAEFRPSAQRA
jgi:cyanophycin synthetase